MSHLLISAAHKSSGKTTLCIGLCAALTRRGYRVQPFKKGPDYIDPLWLSEAAQRPCHNLDFYTMGRAEIIRSFTQRCEDTDIALIEGNKGLYDGLDLDGSNSNAALAHLLGVPVVLVVDARGMTRGIAPLILGYQAFDTEIQIAGVILNRLGGSRHEEKLRAVIEYYTDVKVLGAVHQEKSLQITERHLGLIPSNEDDKAQTQINNIAEQVAKQVDIDQVLALAGISTAGMERRRQSPKKSFSGDGRAPSVRIGVIRDAAFGFYYSDDMDALRAAGAEAVFINALQDVRLPPIDGLFIGGGFPETHMVRLAANHSLKAEIRAAVEDAMPVYAECGGLMYLSRSLRWGEASCEMVGALPLDTVMHERPQGRGYVQLRETGCGLWPLREEQGRPAEFSAHEFHYSKVENLPENAVFAYKVLRGAGIDGKHDGIVYKNTLACYVHLRDVDSNHWVQRFVAFVRMVNG
ncbi:MAG: hydrogenobyrinic acid a,c-diamide synthase (glutamine-hydrolyzing) [Gammaproteobacteria bacterium]|nr:hydrogenobyrinic acid a,c-diamide synthase (glutamine-hydrolyzing) [Gammaproteobacteria bacterium]